MLFSQGAFNLNLENLSDSELVSLENMVRDERQRRSPAGLDIAEKCMVQCGQHLQAIKAYRDRTKAGLRAAKDACDEFRRTVPGWFEGAWWDEVNGKWTHNPTNRW